MAEGKHCEIERKYLIRYPDSAQLMAQPGCEIWKIGQTYLRDGEGGQTRRVRQIEVNGRVEYTRTFKRFVSALSTEEDEARITEAEYRRLLLDRDPGRMTVSKTRYRIPWGGHVLEFDLYPFWSDRAILEIELESEEDAAEIPEWVQIVRDVTGEGRYKNSQIARTVPMEEL